jgi:hypothetical protein
LRRGATVVFVGMEVVAVVVALAREATTVGETSYDGGV